MCIYTDILTYMGLYENTHVHGCIDIKGNQSKHIPPYTFVKVEVRGENLE